MDSGLKLWGIMTATCLVLSSGSPTLVKMAARLAKIVFGDRIQICDGIDDQVEINAALLAAATTPAGFGGDVKLTSGRYNTSAPILMQDKTSLIGSGNIWQTEIALSAGSNCNVIEKVGTGGCYIAHMTVNQNKAWQTSGWCIYIPRGIDNFFYRVFCAYGKEGGMYLGEQWAQRVEECIFEYSDGPGFQHSGPGLRMDNCYSAENGGHGFEFVLNKSLKGNISNCQAYQNGGSGFLINYHFNIFTNCIAEKNSDNGFHIPGAPGRKSILVGCQASYNTNCGFRLEAPEIVMVGCLSTSNGTGLYLSSNIKCAVLGNTIFGNTTEVTTFAKSTTLFQLRWQDVFMDVLAASPNHVVAAENLNIGDIPPGGIHTCTLAAQPDVPRNVTILVTDVDTSITDFTIVVTGTDAKGDAATTETFTLAGGLNQTGNIAFASISSVKINTLAGANVGDTLDVGIGSKLGLGNKVYVTGDVYKVKKNNAHWATANYTVNTTYHTVDVSTGGAILAGDDFTIWYKVILNWVG